MLVHQWHRRQADANRQGTNWPRLMFRMGNPGTTVNPAGWGGGRITEERMRPAIALPSGSFGA